MFRNLWHILKNKKCGINLLYQISDYEYKEKVFC